MANSQHKIIDIENLTKTYGMNPGAVTALKGISMTVLAGEFVSILLR